MTFTTTKKQLYVKEETVEFVGIGHSALVDTANASYIPINPTLEFDPDLQESERLRTTFTKSKRTPGKSTGKLRVELEVTASGASATSDPQFQLLLRACGVRSTDLTKVVWDGSLADLAGPVPNPNRVIRHGTLFSGTATPSGTATGMVIGDVHLPETPAAAAAVMWVGRLEGLGTGQLTTGDIVLTYKGTSVGTIESASIDSVTGNAGTGFWPHSTPISKIIFNGTGLTSNVTAGQILKGATSGAFARVYKDASSGANVNVFIESPIGHFTAGEVIENISSADTDIGTLAASGQEAQVSCPTISFGLNEDGVYSSFFGGRGTATMTWPSGRVGKFAFEISGVYLDTTDQVFLSGITFGQRVPPTFKSAELALGPFNEDIEDDDQLASATYAPCIAQLQLQLGNNVTARECPNSSGGIIGFVIDDRSPKLILDPEVVPEGGFGWVTKLFAADLVRGSAYLGATTPDRFKLGWPAGQVEQAPSAARGKILTKNITLGLTDGPEDSDTGDNEWWIIWQAG